MRTPPHFFVCFLIVLFPLLYVSQGVKGSKNVKPPTETTSFPLPPIINPPVNTVNNPYLVGGPGSNYVPQPPPNPRVRGSYHYGQPTPNRGRTRPPLVMDNPSKQVTFPEYSTVMYHITTTPFYFQMTDQQTYVPPVNTGMPTTWRPAPPLPSPPPPPPPPPQQIQNIISSPVIIIQTSMSCCAFSTLSVNGNNKCQNCNIQGKVKGPAPISRGVNPCRNCNAKRALENDDSSLSDVNMISSLLTQYILIDMINVEIAAGQSDPSSARFGCYRMDRAGDASSCPGYVSPLMNMFLK